MEGVVSGFLCAKLLFASIAEKQQSPQSLHTFHNSPK
jgi:hypothetical protein